MERKAFKRLVRRLTLAVCGLYLLCILSGCSDGGEETMQAEDMVRRIDYDIDYNSGIISFTESNIKCGITSELGRAASPVSPLRTKMPYNPLNTPDLTSV